VNRKERSAPVRYELTIVGQLGPALRHALQPWVTASSQPQTILRVPAPRAGDMVDLIHLAQDKGLEVTYIAARRHG
jgi:hypothetical protein